MTESVWFSATGNGCAANMWTLVQREGGGAERRHCTRRRKTITVRVLDPMPVAFDLSSLLCAFGCRVCWGSRSYRHTATTDLLLPCCTNGVQVSLRYSFAHPGRFPFPFPLLPASVSKFVGGCIPEQQETTFFSTHHPSLPFFLPVYEEHHRTMPSCMNAAFLPVKSAPQEFYTHTHAHAPSSPMASPL